MFKKKCHKSGMAVLRTSDLLVLCECLTNDDIKNVLDWNKDNVRFI